jgi:hypothetical protein
MFKTPSRIALEAHLFSVGARGLCLSACLGLSGWLAPFAARADIYVVVNPANTQRPLSKKEVVDLFMGRTRSFSDGESVVALDLPRGSPVRDAFYASLTGLNAAQLNSYWSRLMYSGATVPPQALASEAEVAKLVKRNPNAIGYLSLDHQPPDGGLRIVYFLKDSP